MSGLVGKRTMREQEVARVFRSLRRERGISMETMAAMCGIDHSFISRIEKCERHLNATTITKVVAGLNLSQEVEDGLLTLAGLLPEPGTTSLARQPIVGQLYRALTDPLLDDARRGSLVRLVQRMLNEIAEELG